jgi:murein L,D-transpeptidase YafK
MQRRILIAIAIIGAVVIASFMRFVGRSQTQQPDRRPADFVIPQAPLPDRWKADFVVVEKSTHRLALFREGQLLRSYRVALGRGGPEPKSRQGDARTPEGTYFIDRHNPHSCCHLALHISYPNAGDVASARARGVSAGSGIEIHGLPASLKSLGSWHRTRDWTHGCIAVTDGEIEEIWGMVPDGTPIEIRY